MPGKITETFILESNQTLEPACVQESTDLDPDQVHGVGYVQSFE